MLRALVGLEAAVRMSHPSAKRAVQTNPPGLGGNRHYKRHSTSPGVEQRGACKNSCAGKLQISMLLMLIAAYGITTAADDATATVVVATVAKPIRIAMAKTMVR